MDVLVTCKYEEDPIKMKALECSQHFPHYNPMGAIRCHGTRVPIRSGPKPNAAFPHPNDGSDKNSLRLAHLLLRYSSLKMFTHRQTRYSLTGIL